MSAKDQVPQMSWEDMDRLSSKYLCARITQKGPYKILSSVCSLILSLSVTTTINYSRKSKRLKSNHRFPISRTRNS